MNNQALRLTEHVMMRMSQRGIASEHLDLIRLIGTEVEGGYLVREKDYRRLEREIKRLRDQAKRLVGKRLVVDGGVVVTAYYARREKEKRLLRDADTRAG